MGLFNGPLIHVFNREVADSLPTDPIEEILYQTADEKALKQHLLFIGVDLKKSVAEQGGFLTNRAYDYVCFGHVDQLALSQI